MGAREGNGGRFRRLSSALAPGPWDARGRQDVEPQDRLGKRQIRKEPLVLSSEIYRLRYWIRLRLT